MNLSKLDGLDLSDSFVLGWSKVGDVMSFELEVSLWPGHPAFEPPPVDEYACYRRARLEFVGAKEFGKLLPQSEAPFTRDPDGSIDYGTIESYDFTEPNTHFLSGDFGSIKIVCQEVSLVLHRT